MGLEVKMKKIEGSRAKEWGGRIGVYIKGGGTVNRAGKTKYAISLW